MKKEKNKQKKEANLDLQAFVNALLIFPKLIYFT